jgi:uncharacterized protein YoxC
VLAKDFRKVEQPMSEERLAKIETNVARLQSDVEHLQTDVSDLKRTMEQVIAKIDKLSEDLNGKIEKLQDALWMTRIELLLIGAGLLAIIARVFQWL